MKAHRASGKGERGEELLRNYFLSLGYYVARGIKFKFQGNEATDVDLWLYMRASSLNRERINVDIKNKATPKAVERIIWTKGLQSILGLDKCVVVTSGTAERLRDFGEAHGVQVLDGTFVGRLNAGQSVAPVRLTEEQLLDSITFGLGSVDGKARVEQYESAKTLLLFQLDFDGCNALVEECGRCMREAIESDYPVGARRLAYLYLSYLLICLDFATRSIALEEQVSRSLKLFDGFRYGARGRAHLDESLDMAEQMILASGSTAVDRGSLRRNVEQELDRLATTTLSEYFGRPEVIKELFKTARELEAAAHEPQLRTVDELTTHAQSAIGVLLDYHGLNRVRFFGASSRRPSPIVGPHPDKR